MSVSKIQFNLDVYANKFVGDGSMLTGLPSSNNDYQGTANHVVVTNNNGNLTDAAYLMPVNGALGTDASSFNGIVKANVGNFSASAIVDGDIDAEANIAISKLNAYPNDNTKVLLADGSWAQVSNNQISDVNPSKLANFPNDNTKVLLADGSWDQVSNNQISGVNVSKISGYPNDGNQLLRGDGDWGKILNANVDIYAAIDRNKLASGNSNQFCVNDNSGNLIDSAALVLNADDLEVNCNNDFVIKKNVYLDANKKHLLNQECQLNTNDNNPADFYTLVCAANKSYMVTFEILVVNTTDANSSGIISGYVKLKQGNNGATPDCSYIIQNASILDAALANIVVDTNVSANTFKLKCTGINAKNLNWYGNVKYISC